MTRRPDLRWVGVAFACVLVSTASAAGQNVEQLRAAGVEAVLRVTPTETTTAGRIVATLEVFAATDVVVELVEPESQPVGQLTVASIKRDGPSLVRPGWFRYELSVGLTPFLGGNYEVPPFTVSYRSPSASGSLATKPVSVIVQSVLRGEDPGVAEPAGLLDLEDGRAAGAKAWLPWLVLIVPFVVAARWWRLRGARRSAPQLPPVRGPFASALAALEREAAGRPGDLERLVETLRSRDPAPIPPSLVQTYERIRFGTPRTDEVQEFRRGLKDYLRERARGEPGAEDFA